MSFDSLFSILPIPHDLKNDSCIDRRPNSKGKKRKKFTVGVNHGRPSRKKLNYNLIESYYGRTEEEKVALWLLKATRNYTSLEEKQMTRAAPQKALEVLKYLGGWRYFSTNFTAKDAQGHFRVIIDILETLKGEI